MGCYSFQLAAEYLVENLSVHNACECLQVAVTYSNVELLGATLRFIEEHTEVTQAVYIVCNYSFCERDKT